CTDRYAQNHRMNITCTLSAHIKTQIANMQQVVRVIRYAELDKNIKSTKHIQYNLLQAYVWNTRFYRLSGFPYQKRTFVETLKCQGSR
ncbi:hypothetical protein ACJX0J_041174, partial [Zea mays]